MIYVVYVLDGLSSGSVYLLNTLIYVVYVRWIVEWICLPVKHIDLLH